MVTYQPPGHDPTLIKIDLSTRDDYKVSAEDRNRRSFWAAIEWILDMPAPVALPLPVEPVPAPLPVPVEPAPLPVEPDPILSVQVSPMPQLQVPLNIWLTSTPDERDAFYINAGFDPNLPVIDNGTDTQAVRFRQDEPSIVATAVAPSGSPQAGDDLRDFPQSVSVLTGDNPVTDEFGIAAPAAFGAVGISVAGRALRLIMGGGGGRLTSAIWNSLPSLVRTALTQVGIGVGALIAFNGDIPFITLPGQGGAVQPFTGPLPLTPGVDIQIGGLPSPMVGVQIVGSWNTNPGDPSRGVTFYRLSDGKLAVQNKKGRWKVWKPKKPIVLYANGASNLKTMLRADKALTKQAKKIAAMLNRRAPRSRKSAPKAHSGVVIPGSSVVIDT